MTIYIVDLLEPVDIQIKQTEIGFNPFKSFPCIKIDISFEYFIKMALIVQSGQIVNQGEFR